MLRKFDNSPDLGYKSKQVHNEPIEAYFYLIKHITMLTKSERRVRSKFVKLGVNKKIARINETIRHVNKAIQYKELESNNETTTFRDKYKKL